MNWICLDIETADASVEAIEAAMEEWKPPGSCKRAETIEAKRQEAVARYQEKAALLDASPIICIAAIADTGQQLLFTWMTPTFPIADWERITGNDLTEEIMLFAFRQWLASFPLDTTIVGHHVRGFDLPKLRQAFIRHRLRLPDLLSMNIDPSLNVVDTMYLIRSFSMELHDDRFISLNRVAVALGIDRPKQLLNGADVPKLYEVGQYQEILTYCAIDCSTTARAYALMTGQAPDLS
jgi:hypothetical protein